MLVAHHFLTLNFKLLQHCIKNNNKPVRNKFLFFEPSNEILLYDHTFSMYFYALHEKPFVITPKN